MSTLTFDLSYDDLVDCFGPDRVERSVREDAAALGFTGPTLEFLRSTGIPSTLRAGVGAPGKEISLRAFGEMSREQWRVPEESRNWIILGNLSATTVSLDTATGAVFGFDEGFEDPVALHADVSSLAYTIYAVKCALAEIAGLSAFDERNTVIQSVRQEIDDRDPLPFAHEDGEWNATLEEIAMGMWA